MSFICSNLSKSIEKPPCFPLLESKIPFFERGCKILATKDSGALVASEICLTFVYLPARAS